MKELYKVFAVHFYFNQSEYTSEIRFVTCLETYEKGEMHYKVKFNHIRKTDFLSGLLLLRSLHGELHANEFSNDLFFADVIKVVKIEG